MFEELEAVEYSDIAVGVKSIRGDYTRDNLGFDGGRVKVGQIEFGLPKTGISELSATKITRYGSASTNDHYNNHASLVAAIIADKTGMAPQAELYSITFNSILDFYGNAEQLITSNVSVINMSAGIDDESGDYNFLSKWVDHIVYQHNVSWVNSAGNNGIGSYVTSTL